MSFNKTQVIRHTFGGGWATDFGPSIDGAPDAGGHVSIPFLLEAIDCLFELDGGPHEIGGASQVNAAAVASGAVINGVFDYWRQGTGGAPARRRILHSGTVCLADTDDGVFTTTLSSGLESGKVPSYCTFDDLLIYASDSTTDVPRSWDQTTAQNLAGTPPRFSFCVAHKNRAWAAGNYANPSRLYYSANVDPEDWVGATSGSIDIDPNDGDMITGLVSHKDILFVFKGPNKGAIHVITGSSPTGSDAFSRKNYAKGIGACWHNAIFPYGSDIGFVSQFGTVHSLDATANYGDFIEASLSRPINTWIRDHINYTRLRYISTAQDVLRGIVYITMSIDSSTTNNVTLVMDFRDKTNLRWSRIDSYPYGGVGSFIDTNGLRRVLAGGNDGYVRRINMPNRTIDSTTELNYKWTTPYMTYGNAQNKKTISASSISIYPWSASNMTFNWKRDGEALQSDSVGQGGGLETNIYLDRHIELVEGGEFTAIQYGMTQAINNEDIEVHSFSTTITPGANSSENYTAVYDVDAVDFGTSGNMTLASDPTFLADSKMGILSVWLRFDGGDGTKMTIIENASGRFSVTREASGKLQILGKTTGGSNTLLLTTTLSTYTAGATWYHLLASWNLASAGSGFVYVSNSNVSTVTTYNDNLIDYTSTAWAIGSTTASTVFFDGCMAEFYFAPGQYMDISILANRRRFISLSGKPVSLSNGSGAPGYKSALPTGIAAIEYHTAPNGGTTFNFSANSGRNKVTWANGIPAMADTSPSD